MNINENIQKNREKVCKCFKLLHISNPWRDPEIKGSTDYNYKTLQKILRINWLINHRHKYHNPVSMTTIYF